MFHKTYIVTVLSTDDRVLSVTKKKKKKIWKMLQKIQVSNKYSNELMCRLDVGKSYPSHKLCKVAMEIDMHNGN